MIEDIKMAWFSAIRNCLMSLGLFLARNFFFTSPPFFMELYVSFLEANQERNNRIAHYMYYGEQIRTTRTGQYLLLKIKIFLFWNFDF